MTPHDPGPADPNGGELPPQQGEPPSLEPAGPPQQPTDEPSPASHEGETPPESHESTDSPEPATPPAPPAPPAPKVSGTIQSLDDEDAVVQLEDGRTARMRKVDLADAQGKIHAQVGDKVEGVLHEEGETLRLAKRSARAEAIAALADVFTSKQPIEARVTHGVKGGYEVRINGLRAFCPSSQISLRRDDLHGDPVGQTLTFVLTKWDPEGRSLVVSRRKLLEREQKKLAAEAKTRIAPGVRMTGRVVGFQPYGAFVDLGGIQGLLHLTEMSWSRVHDPRALLQVGQEVDVVVLEHDEGFKKVRLSRKSLEQDPWQANAETLQAGRIVKGTSKRVASVGAFIELQPGLEGLMPARVESDGPSDLPAPGTDLLVRIVDVDARRHRVTLAVAPEGSNEGDVVEAPAVEKGARIEGIVDHVVPFGVFVKLGHKKTGLLHATESKVPQGGDLAAAFPVGMRVAVEILEISEDGQKIKLTRRNPAERAMAAAARNAARGPARGPGGPGAPGGPGGPMGGRGERGGFGDRGERGPRRDGRTGGPGGERRDAGRGFGGGGGRGGDFGDRPRGERRPRREGGGEPVHNPAAAPRTGFAVIGDAFRAQLAAREAEQKRAAEAAAEAAASEPDADTGDGDQPSP